jgi:DegV family protein with EDD domain
MFENIIKIDVNAQGKASITNLSVTLIVDGTIDFIRESDKSKVSIVNVGIFSKNEQFKGSMEEFYKLLELKESGFSTKEASVQDFESAIMQSKADSIIIVTASKHLSKNYDNAFLAAKNHSNVLVFDSKLISGAYGLLISKIIDDLESKTDYESTVSRIPMHKDKISSYFAVGNINHLIRGRRISKFIGFFIKIARINPVLKLFYGRIVNNGKNLSDGRMTKGLMEYLAKKIGSNFVYIFENKVFKNKNEAMAVPKNSRHCGKLNPSIATHLGPEYVSIFWYNE